MTTDLPAASGNADLMETLRRRARERRVTRTDLDGLQQLQFAFVVEGRSVTPAACLFFNVDERALLETG